MMRKIRDRLLTTLLWSSLAALALPGAARAQFGEPQPRIGKDNRTIAITATERIVSPADVATVHIGFHVYAPDKNAAYALATRTSNAIMDALGAAGVAQSNVQSDTQQVEPTPEETLNEFSERERVNRAFSVEQSWTVRSKAGDAARVLYLAVRAGANDSGSIDWALSDPNAAQSTAATKAIQRARTQAAAMAEGLGARLGPLLFASNQVEGSPERPTPDALTTSARMVPHAAALPVVAAKSMAINAQEVESTATVYAVFALE